MTRSGSPVTPGSETDLLERIATANEDPDGRHLFVLAKPKFLSWQRARYECAFRHTPTVTSSRRLRDLWRTYYWVRCWDCDLRTGPHLTRDGAEKTRQHLDEPRSLTGG
jgi:hypothetical protein